MSWQLFPLILLLFPLMLLTVSATEVIRNGGFESGLDGWSQRGCQMSAETWDAYEGAHSCHVSSRQEAWAGPEQVLDLSLLQGESSAQLSYAIKIHAGADSFQHSWTLQLENREGQLSYVHLADWEVTSDWDWADVQVQVDLPQLDGIKEARLYLEGSPVSAEPLLDSVSLIVGGGEGGTTEGPGGWRGEADARIRELRQSDLTVTVANTGGEGLSLELTQLRHSFPFGTALQGSLVKSCLDQGEDDAYCTFAKENFNFVVLENAMKWGSIEPKQGQFRYTVPDATIAWAAERGLRARGHCLFWAVPHHQTPSWVESLQGEELVTAVSQHVDDMFDHFGSKVEAWDVNNEMLHGQFFVDQSGDPDIRVKMFQWAHDKDPEMMLFVNDYNIIAGNQGAKYITFIKELLGQGAPISGIGVQGHFGNHAIDINKVKSLIEELGQFGLPIWVTEFDWSGSESDHSQHARQLEDFYRLMFSLPQVGGVVMWGFWDQAHWRPQAAIVNGDQLTPNSAGEAYLRLMHQEWSSSSLLEMETESVKQRVFQGDYRARVLRGGFVLATREFTVGTDDVLVTIEL